MARIERSTARLYYALASREGDPGIAATLYFIASDSEKHAGIFKFLAGNRKAPTHARCLELLGEMYSRVSQELRRIRGRLRMGVSAAEVVRDLVRYEESVGEEYFTRAYTGILSAHPNPELARNLLRFVSEDEDRHAELLGKVAEAKR